MDSWLVRGFVIVCVGFVVVVVATAHPYVAAAVGLGIGALVWRGWRFQRGLAQAGRARSVAVAAALDGDASGATEANGWLCAGRVVGGGEPPWAVRWRTLHGREGLDVSTGGHGIPGGDPAVLVPTGRLFDEVQVEVPCAVTGQIAWSARAEPLPPGRDPAAVTVAVDAQGTATASTDGVAVMSIRNAGKEAAKAEAVAVLGQMVAAAGESVRVGHGDFDARVRSRTADPGLLAKVTGADEVRSRILALTVFNAPFDATIGLREGALTWTSLVTTQTDAEGLRAVVAGMVELARGLEGRAA